MGFSEVPCRVRELDDEAAYMLLATSNAQSEWTALERGRHALRSGLDTKAYAESVGRARQTVDNEIRAARVAQAVPDIGHATPFSQLIEIHAALKWLWAALVEAMIEHEWTVEQTRGQVAVIRQGLNGPLGSLEGPVCPVY